MTVIRRASKSETITRLPAKPAKSSGADCIASGRSRTAWAAFSGLATNSKLNAVKWLAPRVMGDSILHVGPERSEKAATDKIERSEEHTSELQSLAYLVCRLLLEKKKKQIQ